MIMIHILALAREIGVHRNTIRNWVKTGKSTPALAPAKA